MSNTGGNTGDITSTLTRQVTAETPARTPQPIPQHPDQNPNHGGAGIAGTAAAIAAIVPTHVTVTSADNQPTPQKLTGPNFLPGEPAGREAKPRPRYDAHKSVVIGS